MKIDRTMIEKNFPRFPKMMEVFVIFLSLMILSSGERELDRFQLREGKTAHDFRSDKIILINTKTIKIPNIYYDGKGPSAYWIVGYNEPPAERPSENPGHKIPNERGSCDILHKYTGDTIQLILPGNYTVNNIDWLAMYCIQYKHTFGWVDFKTPRGSSDFFGVPEAGSDVVPPQPCGQSNLAGNKSIISTGLISTLFLKYAFPKLFNI